MLGKDALVKCKRCGGTLYIYCGFCDSFHAAYADDLRTVCKGSTFKEKEKAGTIICAGCHRGVLIP